MAILEIKNLEKSFDKTKVLKDVSFQMEKGEVVSVIGSSGSGKTTLLRCISFLEKADGGEIILNGETIFDAKQAKQIKGAKMRGNQLKFGFVFQNFNLFPQYTALENVILAPRLIAKERPDFKANKDKIYAEITEKAKELLTRAGLSDKFDNYPCELSGGQQQRVAIARAIASEPEIILADEPTGNLDANSSREIMDILKNLHKQGATVVLITHDKTVADMAERQIEIFDGEICS